MSEPSVPRKLLSDFSRMNVDAEGKATMGVTKFAKGDMITPTQAELDAFGDRFEPLQVTPQAPDEPPPDETTSARSRR